MRKQYHFRQSPEGLLAWDVHRLIRLVEGLPSHEIEVSSIAEIDEVYWGGAGEQEMTCREIAEHARLIREVDPAYPIILCADGRVMDGMHRVLGALLRQENTIRAVRFPVTPEPDHIGVAPSDLPYD